MIHHPFTFLSSFQPHSSCTNLASKSLLLPPFILKSPSSARLLHLSSNPSRHCFLPLHCRPDIRPTWHLLAGSRISRQICAFHKERRRDTMLLTMKDEEKERTAEKEALLSNSSYDKLITLPTILTLGRVAAVPILLFVFYSKERWATAAVASIFVLAAATDWLDGYLARRMGSNSAFGAFLDPVADKLMVATTLVLLCTRPPSAWTAAAPWLISLPATAIIGREITMSAVREWAAAQGGHLHKAVAVSSLGKWKTALQMVALTMLLATRDVSLTGLTMLFGVVGVGLLYISAGMALWSLAIYMKSIWGSLVK